VVPALVLAAYGPRRLGYRILGAALVVGLFGWWPLPVGNQGGYDPKAQLLPRGLLLLAPSRGNSRAAVEFTWRGLELIVGNYYVLTLLVFIAATASALVLTHRLRPERAQSAPSPMPCGRHARPASPGRAISILNGRRCAHLRCRPGCGTSVSPSTASGRTGSSTSPAAAGSKTERPPACYPVIFTENSGNGPTYHLRICDALGFGRPGALV
jgi:hypothetical protein